MTMHWLSALILVGGLVLLAGLVLSWLEWVLSDEGDPYE